MAAFSPVVVAALFLGFLCLLVGIGSFIASKVSSGKKAAVTEESAGTSASHAAPVSSSGHAAPSRPRGQGAGGASRMRRGRRQQRAQAEEIEQSIEEEEAEAVPAATAEEGEEGEEDSDDGLLPAPGRRTKKEQRRQEREQRRQYAEAVREAKREKEQARLDKSRQKDEEREEAERRAEEELERIRAEKEAAELAEYEKWKGSMSVAMEGTVEEDVQAESQGLLTEFIDHIKRNKVVVLEELAAEFGLRTQDVINRVQALEKIGRITGVMDDRGKFIYISMEEMQQVADFMKKRGRVSIAELARMSNSFIDLVPAAKEVDQSYVNETGQEGVHSIENEPLPVL